MSKDFILASASDSRLNLLMRIGMIPTRVIGMDVDEAVQRHETPMEMALRFVGIVATSGISGKLVVAV